MECHSACYENDEEVRITRQICSWSSQQVVGRQGNVVAHSFTRRSKETRPYRCRFIRRGRRNSTNSSTKDGAGEEERQAFKELTGTCNTRPSITTLNSHTEEQAEHCSEGTHIIAARRILHPWLSFLYILLNQATQPFDI